MNPVSQLPLIGRFFRRPAEERPRSRTYYGIDSLRRKAKPLFFLIRAFFRAAIRTQHREIRAIGLENIPPDGSVLLVGNHPNSFLDYFNLLNVIRHPMATAAKDTITNWPLLGPILRHHMLMVPISRRMDHNDGDISEEDRRKQNEDSLRESVELLVRGRLFNIFVEGRSTDSRKLNKLKLGFMYIALQAEKEFNFNLNLQLVPYGFYYSRINKFQSSVCVIFGKPVKLKNLIADVPDDFLALSESERSQIEKKLMVAGKERITRDIEDIIISIPDKHLVDLIDDTTAVYALTPAKYMGPFGNIREKYRLSKILADTVVGASRTDRGRERLEKLRRTIVQYRKDLRSSGLRDALIRREHTWAELGYFTRVLFQGLLLSPVLLAGYVTNFLPRMAGRFMRYSVIDIQKRPKVDGDEQAMIAATVTALFVYPLVGVGVALGLALFAGEAVSSALRALFTFPQPADLVAGHWNAIAAVAGAAAAVLMPRLWRFSVFYGQQLKNALYWIGDFFAELVRGSEVRRLREKRYEIVDATDFLIGDYGE